MITLTREEAQQVLDALKFEADGWELVPKRTRKAIETLRARLAEPEQTIQQFAEKLAAAQEPLGYDAAKVLHDNLPELYAKSEPIYPAPVAASDTSQERVAETEEKRHDPKPQAWMLITEQGVCGGIFRFRYDAEVGARELRERFSIVPLYYSELPQREWQGLTDEERNRVLETTHPENRCTIAERIEAKLKEKNHD